MRRLDSLAVSSYYNWAKTLLDYALACLALIVLSPLFLVLALIVKVDSGGPVIYRRRVMGRCGRQFDAFKFRTMYVDGDAILAGYPELRATWCCDQKLKVDPRITRSGRWMRKASLDELPQLINILRGEMSLVGPRMIAPSELTNYGAHATDLLTVKPGLTGLWQVSGRSDLDRDTRVQMDLVYARENSFWLDLKLIFLTIPAVARGRGAY
jgi:lipopolysaccharide/colanic/teichoic acid biosynthesis glycosyltransferase